MAYVLTTQAQVLCPHGGQVQLAPSVVEFDIGGSPVVGPFDPLVVEGCPFTTDDGRASPCDSVDWMGFGKYAGLTVLTSESIGVAMAAGMPQGQVTILETQTEVEAAAFESTGAFVLTEASTLTCPHGGLLQVQPQAHDLKADGSVVLRPSDPVFVVDCQNRDEPCLGVQWMNPFDWRFAGAHVLTTRSVGMTDGGSPGMVQILLFQTRAEADRG